MDGYAPRDGWLGRFMNRPYVPSVPLESKHRPYMLAYFRLSKWEMILT
jgi:hypothetical protein